MSASRQRFVAVVAAAIATTSCGSSSTSTAPRGDASQPESALGDAPGDDGPSDASHDATTFDADAADAPENPGDARDAGDAGEGGQLGACVEGMECQQTDFNTHHTDFDCFCQSGAWQCPVWTSSSAPGTGLPSTDPSPQQGCLGSLPNGGVNVACSMPDHCGTICVCGTTTGSNWSCRTISADGDAEVFQSGVPDASASAYPDAGCQWPPCSLVGGASATCPANEDQCFVVNCDALLCGPAGSSGPLIDSCTFSN